MRRPAALQGVLVLVALQAVGRPAQTTLQCSKCVGARREDA